MKTTSVIALSSLVASSVLSGVTGQMVPLQGSDGNPAAASVQGLVQSIKQNVPGLQEIKDIHAPPAIKDTQAPKAVKDIRAPPAIKGSRKRPAQTDHQQAAQIVPPEPDVVHITKTKTEIVYPRPNPRLWKYLPEFPSHGPQGKIVAEFKIDDEGHFHKGRKHGGWDHQKGEYHRLAIKGEDYPHNHKGYHHNGEVYYEGGNGWSGGKHVGSSQKGREHKGDKEKGKGDEHPHQEGKKGDRKEKGDGKHGKDDMKKKDNSRHGKGDEEPDKKKMDGFKSKKVDGFIAAQSVNGTESTGSASLSASADVAQNTGSASGLIRNAAGASSSAASQSSASSSPKPSSSSSSSTSASSNTHQVALSFVAVMATAAAWCLA